jgi:hypothetical protein
MPLFEAVHLAGRFDIALMSTKGLSNMTVSPSLPSSANGMATSVFMALPCAPRVGIAWACRLDARTLKSSIAFTVVAAIPGPLSMIVIEGLGSDRTATSMTVAVPASSAALSALSNSSLTSTSGH